MAEIGSIIDGKYEILTEIGHGGMSIVYLAMDTHLNKQWAVKEIKKKSNGANAQIIVNSLLAEANLMKRLDHPSLPRIVDIIDNGVTIYIVMDYIEGESLDKILTELGPQPEELVIGWAKQLCDALSYLHSQKPPIIYRDMKPANIMLKPEGNIKIIDFGIAREYKELSLADTTVLGTKGYAPPEQYSGQTDPRSDIYALGMTLHHLLTGVDPRKCEGYAPVRVYNSDLSEGIELIIEKCVQPAQENRYQNCSDLLYDLEHPELITKDYKKKQKRKLGLFVASVILSAALFVTGFACNSRAVKINNNQYDKLVEPTSSMTDEQKFESYEKAIEIYPGRPQAYINMLNTYKNKYQNISEGDIEFEKQYHRFTNLYNKNYEEFNPKDEEFADLNFWAGIMFFTYMDDYGMSETYFKTNHDNAEYLNADTLKVSEAFYNICQAESAGGLLTEKKDYSQIMDDLNNIVEIDMGVDHLKVMAYQTVIKFLYDNTRDMAKDNISLEEITGLYEKTYNLVENMNDLKQEASIEIREAILSWHKEGKWEEKIIDTYNETIKIGQEKKEK